jgi:hypothetical protein
MKNVLLSLSAALILTSCFTIVPVSNTANLENTDFSNLKTMSKSSACANYIFGFIGPIGSNSISKAIWAGQIQKVKLVESQFNWYVVFTQQCTTVYGESIK